MNDPERHLERFWPQLAASARRVLMLDYDGTLAPFTPVREAAWPYPKVERELEALLHAGGTRLLIVSGRPVSQLLSLLRIARWLELYGVYGLEHRSATGQLAVTPVPREVQQILDAEYTAALAAGLVEHLERKPGCLGLHWRGLPPGGAARLREYALANWSAGGGSSELQVHDFDGGMELRWQTATKEHAIQAVIQQEPGAALAYLGDDSADDEAFRALARVGLSVLVRPEFRPSAAQLWLHPPDELAEFLRRWRQASLPEHATAEVGKP